MLGSLAGELRDFVAKTVPAPEGPLTFTGPMPSKSSGPAQAFWTTGRFPAFFRDRSPVVQMAHDGAWHDYRAELRPDDPRAEASNGEAPQAGR